MVMGAYKSFTQNKADIECYYKNFRAICEVTLNTSKLQWV